MDGSRLFQQSKGYVHVCMLTLNFIARLEEIYQDSSVSKTFVEVCEIEEHLVSYPGSLVMSIYT